MKDSVCHPPLTSNPNSSSMSSHNFQASSTASSSYSSSSAGAGASSSSSSGKNAELSGSFVASVLQDVLQVNILLAAFFAILGVILYFAMSSDASSSVLNVHLSTWCFFSAILFFAWSVCDFVVALVSTIVNVIDFEGRVEVYLDAVTNSVHILLFMIVTNIVWNLMLDSVQETWFVIIIHQAVLDSTYTALLYAVKQVVATHVAENRSRALFAVEVQLALFREKLLRKLADKKRAALSKSRKERNRRRWFSIFTREFWARSSMAHMNGSSSSVDNLSSVVDPNPLPSFASLADDSYAKNVSLAQFRSFRNFIKESKLRTFKRVRDHVEVNEFQTRAEVEGLVRVIWWNLSRPLEYGAPQRDVVTIDDFARQLGREPTAPAVAKAFEQFCHAKDDKVRRTDVDREVVSIYRHRAHLGNSLRNIEGISRVLSLVLDIPFWLIVLMAWLVSFGYDLVTVVLPLTSVLLGAGFMFRPMGKIMFETAVLFLGVQSFAVGDRIRIKGNKEIYKIRSLGVFSTRAHSIQGDEVTIPNSVLFNDQVHNLRRNPSAWFWLDFQVSVATPTEALHDLKQGIIDHLKQNSDIWNPNNCMIETTSIVDAARLNMLVYAECKCSWQDRAVWMPAKSKLVEHVARLLDKLDIAFLPPRQRIELYEEDEIDDLYFRS
jgi:small-conductance mechanosensitive channel